MSDEEKAPAKTPPALQVQLPTGIDPVSGLPMVGTLGYPLAGKTLSLQKTHPQQQPHETMWDQGFGTSAQKSLANAVGATWCYTSIAILIKDQEIAALFGALETQAKVITLMGEVIVKLTSSATAMSPTELSELTDQIQSLISAPDAPASEPDKNGPN